MLAAAPAAPILAGQTAPTAPDLAAGLRGGEDTTTADVLRELYLRNFSAKPVDGPSPWLAAPTGSYVVRGQRLQFAATPDSATARSAKWTLIKRLRQQAGGRGKPDYLARCRNVLAIEAGTNGPVLGAVTGLCEHPLDLKAMAEVEANLDVRWLLRRLERRGLAFVPYDRVSARPLDAGFGYAWDKGFLHIFPYTDATQARAAAARFREESTYPDGQMFRCGTAIAIHFRSDDRAREALRQMCGPPQKPGIPKDSGE